MVVAARSACASEIDVEVAVSNCVVAGIPARIIRRNLSDADFKEMNKPKTRGDNPFPETPGLVK